MFEITQLTTFAAAVAAMVIVPGPNTVLILSSTAEGGRSAGLATVLGIETGTLIHTLAAALGLSSVLVSSPLVFDAVKYAGAAYLAVLGVTALARRSEPSQNPTGPARQLPSMYGRAVISNLLNPKVAIFFLALLPQFVQPERGHLPVQFAVLGGIVSVIGLANGLALASAAGVAQRWQRHPNAAWWQRHVSAVFLIGLSAQLLFSAGS